MATTNGAGSPQSILIVGAGVFGLSAALTLLDRPAYSNSTITVIDSANVLPNPVGSSVDASRIVRADYGNKSYAKLASEAQDLWRDTSPTGWGGEGRYHETGFVLTGDHGYSDYVLKSMKNVQDLAASGKSVDSSKIQGLNGKDEIRKATGYPGASGDVGYANFNSGWADAEACVAFALRKIKSHPAARDRVNVRPGCKVSKLLYTDNLADRQCAGVQLEDGSSIHADLTILATGAWTPSLFNLEYRCLATGQVIAYLQISPEEQAYLEKTPVVINFAKGTFVIPPRNCELKIARHGYGYRNPLHVNHPSLSTKEVSIPRTDTSIPIEAETSLRKAFAEFFPPNPLHSPTSTYPSSLSTISTRPFSHTRVCWYNDTPTGNFLIDYPPLPTNNSSSSTNASTSTNRSLFLATGGSGHGFKFFPTLGKYIVDALERKLAPEYAELWRWTTNEEIEARFSSGEYKDAHRQFIECEDGSRGGPRGMILQDELAKGAAKL